MSKYDPLWKWIKENGTDSFKLTYAEIEEIAGVWISGRQDIDESRNGSFRESGRIMAAYKILPVMEIPKSIWIWIGVIAMIKIINIISGFVVAKQFVSVHTAANKITGLLMFVLPLTMAVVELRYSALAVCVAATFAAIQEGHFIRIGTAQFQFMDSFDDDDEQDVFAEAELDYDELEFMDPKERREVLEEAGLNPDEFDF